MSSEHNKTKRQSVAEDEERSGEEEEKDDAPVAPAPKVRNWKDWCIRGFFSLLMIGGFAFIVWAGPPVLMLVILFVQLMCFKEIISIGHSISKVKKLPWFRVLNWYFLFIFNFYCFGDTFMEEFVLPYMPRDVFLNALISKHKFMSFVLYMTGFVLFVLSLKKGHYKFQFGQFAWTHITLLIIVTQSSLVVFNVFQGLIWFLVPISLVICNDIMAYMFGFFFGRTPLIKLSPKKTWEGFIGAFFSTVVFGFFLSKWLAKYEYFTCPIVDVFDVSSSRGCPPDPVFLPHEYLVNLPTVIQDILSLFGIDVSSRSVTLLPIQLHSLAFSAFASVIAPFGGFFASGFKRAFNIKDFGDAIPGHGGLTDRFDCQYLMATFAFVYHSSFVRAGVATVASLTAGARSLSAEDQLILYRKLQDIIASTGALAGEAVTASN